MPTFAGMNRPALVDDLDVEALQRFLGGDFRVRRDGDRVDVTKAGSDVVVSLVPDDGFYFVEFTGEVEIDGRRMVKTNSGWREKPPGGAR